VDNSKLVHLSIPCGILIYCDMKASGSGEYVPHGVAYQKTVILMLIAVKTTNLMVAVILHIAFHKSHGSCYTLHCFPQISWQLL
jgi:hypothetical protein